MSSAWLLFPKTRSLSSYPHSQPKTGYAAIDDDDDDDNDDKTCFKVNCFDCCVSFMLEWTISGSRYD